MEPKRAQWKQELKLHNTQKTDRFVHRFTLHREYRTIKPDNVTYKTDKYPSMYKTMSRLSNKNMKSEINTIATITTSDFISAGGTIWKAVLVE